VRWLGQQQYQHANCYKNFMRKLGDTSYEIA